MTVTSLDRAPLGDATPTAAELTALVSQALGRDVTLADYCCTPVPYEAGSPATGGLFRFHGRTDDRARWSLFLKVLQHPRHWRHLDRVPPPFRQDFVATFPWRCELAAWDPEFLAALPSGLRVPTLYRLVDLPQDRVAVWMEDVQVSDEPWGIDRFARAAELLGGLAANRSGPELLAGCQVPPGYGLRRYADGPVTGALAAIADDRLWQHPSLSTAQGRRVRAGLLALAPGIRPLLDRLDACPQALPHGDASPQNLLVPVAEPGTLVAIDIAFQCPLAIGFDLAQLLVGLVHAGEMPAADLADVHRRLQPAFIEGFAAAGGAIGRTEVGAGYLGSLLVRNAFTSIPYGELDLLPAAVIDERLVLTEFLCSLAAELPG